MNKTSQKKEANHQTPHSSITVSDKIVCEDDACIGKVAGPQSKPTVERERQDKKRRKRQGTSIRMQARGSLMTEHRLIERMLNVIKGASGKIEAKHEVDPVFVDIAVDFIRVYADRTHHGKEEDILFRELNKKGLKSEDNQIMQELIDEHAFGRQTTKALVEANTRYRNGDETALADITDNLKTLVDFYPRHIEKEDKIFFPRSRTYFTDEEDRAMLEEFWEFDRNMIHEKYKSMVEVFESQK